MKYPIRRFEYARIVNVVDGDTCDIEVDLGFGAQITHRFRLARINAPERGTPGGSEATEFLKQFDGHDVEIEVTKLDKYGRYLAEITVPSFSRDSLNDRMMDMGLAVAYA